MRKRRPKGSGKSPFCKCGKLKERPAQGYCNDCRNKHSRENRKRHWELPEEQRKKANARAYVKEYIKRGNIEKQPCVVCGTMENLEAHHEDYNKPLEVIWYCRKHHVEMHEEAKKCQTDYS